MIAATVPSCAASLLRRSPTSIAPSEPHLTTTTRSPASTALAAFVPCADSGIRQTVRSGCPCERWYPRIASSPASSPCEPAFGWRLMASYPVISVSASASSPISCRYPSACSAGANGCSPANSGHVIASISAAALSFIVHEPSGIIERSSAMSRSASRRRYLSIAVSLR